MPKLTEGQRVIRDLAREIERKAVRLRNKASLVAGDPTPGRNLTALRNTAGEMLALIEAICDRRCRVCGCTHTRPCETDGGPCAWVAADLCDACSEGPS